MLNYDEYLQASNGTGEAVRSNVVVERPIGSTEINVDTVLNWPNKFIATSGVLDAVTGTFSPSTITVFFGHINGTYLTIDEFAPGYSDRGNTANEIIVLKPTTPWSDKVAVAVTNAVHKVDTLAATTYDTSIKAYVDAAITAAKTAMRIVVGDLHLSTSSTNPATSLGYGTWVAWGSGRVPVGVDTGQTEFNTVEKIGGDKNLQSHIHYLNIQNSDVEAGGYSLFAGAGGFMNRAQVTASGFSKSTGSTGSGSSQNLQPYITCYMFKRTA
jgi:hypothetical protein